MSIPVWVLLGFAAWTMVILFTTVGTYRWSRIFTGRAEISEWQAAEQQGSDWYRRAIRAHLTCVENLPVYTQLSSWLCLPHTSTITCSMDWLSRYWLHGSAKARFICC